MHSRKRPWVTSQVLDESFPPWFDSPASTYRNRSETYSKSAQQALAEQQKVEGLLKNLIIEIEESKSGSESAPLVRTYRRLNKWKLLRSVIRAVALFRRHEVEIIENGEQLEKALESYRPQGYALPYPKLHSLRTQLDDMRRENEVYRLVARGAPEDIKALNELLSSGAEQSIVNRPNKFGRTPLYIASQNGNLQMIKCLLANKADLGRRSKVSEREEESNLAVAARWSHENVVGFYLVHFEWRLQDLQQALAGARTDRIRRKLASLIRKQKKCCFFYLFH